MITMSNLVRLALVTAALTLAGLAAVEARDVKVTYPPVAAVATNPAGMAAPAFITIPDPAVADSPAAPTPVAAVVQTNAEKTAVGQTTAERIIETPGCRKVKVIYAGYGEKDRAGCGRL